jgi:THO complex subunit 1
MASVEVEAVQVYRGLVDNLLDRAAKVKTDKQIEPPLTEALLGDRIWQLPVDDKVSEKLLNQQTQFAAVEIAFREKFYHILVRRMRFLTHKLDDIEVANDSTVFYLGLHLYQ